MTEEQELKNTVKEMDRSEKEQVLEIINLIEQIVKLVVMLNQRLAKMTPRMASCLTWRYFNKIKTIWNWKYGCPLFPVGLNTVGMAERGMPCTDIDAVHLDEADDRLYIFETKFNRNSFVPDKQVKVLKWICNCIKAAGKKFTLVECTNDLTPDSMMPKNNELHTQKIVSIETEAGKQEVGCCAVETIIK